MPEGRLLRVRLRPKPPAVTDIAALAGEFVNLLLDETLREEIGRETEPVRNLILAHALSETALLRPELETADPEADPLGSPSPTLSGNGRDSVATRLIQERHALWQAYFRPHSRRQRLPLPGIPSTRLLPVGRLPASSFSVPALG